MILNGRDGTGMLVHSVNRDCQGSMSSCATVQAIFSIVLAHLAPAFTVERLEIKHSQGGFTRQGGLG